MVILRHSLARRFADLCTAIAAEPTVLITVLAVYANLDGVSACAVEISAHTHTETSDLHTWLSDRGWAPRWVSDLTIEVRIEERDTVAAVLRPQARAVGAGEDD